MNSIGNIIDKIMYYIVYHFFKAYTCFLLKCFNKWTVIGKENVPKKGGIMCMGNHASLWDPPMIGSGTWKRTFKFMGKAALTKTPIWGQIIKWTGTFPLERGMVHRGSYDTLINSIKSGDAVVFFPEGTRSTDGEIHEGKPGTGMLVYQARAAVIPVYLHNTNKGWPKGQLFPSAFKNMTMYYGEIMHFDEYFDREPNKALYIEITEKIMTRIKEMKAAHLKMLEEKKK